MRRLALPGAIVLLGLGLRGAQATTLHYEFLGPQSQIAVTCGFGLCDDVYSIRGSLGLDLDFASGRAAFVDVDAMFVGEGIASGRRLDTVLGPQLVGTLVNESTILFGRRSPPPPEVFKAQMVGEVLKVTGGFDDTFLDGEAISIDAVAVSIGSVLLQAGDADRDRDFDQFDLIQVQKAGKYLTGQPATWGEGDWDGAPGRIPGVVPLGNGRFDQFDIIAALNADTYLTGPYAAVNPERKRDDGQASLVYDAGEGEVAVNLPAGIEPASISTGSAAVVSTGQPTENPSGDSDRDAGRYIFRAAFGGSFGSMRFERVARARLDEESLLNELLVVGSLPVSGDLGDVDSVYLTVPEPGTILLFVLGLLLGLMVCRQRTDQLN